MLEDPTELALADLLKADLPGPRPGWEVRALAALAGVRPRRHPNLVRIIVVTLILLILAAGAYAAVRLLIPGTLSFNQARRGEARPTGRPASTAASSPGRRRNRPPTGPVSRLAQAVAPTSNRPACLLATPVPRTATSASPTQTAGMR